MGDKPEIVQLFDLEPGRDGRPAQKSSEVRRSPSGSAAFDKLRDYLQHDRAVRVEVENAFAALTERINVSDRGSRFVAGKTGEWIIAAALYSAGVIAIPEGHNVDGFDLSGVEAAAKGLFSVKCSFSPTSAFRISNGINGSGRGFVEPTIFVHQRLGGLAFADPVEHVSLAAKAQKKPDAVLLGMAHIKEHVEAHPECLIPLAVPLNKGRGTYDPAMEFTKSLLTQEGVYPNLSRVFEDVRKKSAGGSIVEGILQLRLLMDEGALTEEQFKRAVDILL
jgi:hypothetical protein